MHKYYLEYLLTTRSTNYNLFVKVNDLVEKYKVGGEKEEGGKEEGEKGKWGPGTNVGWAVAFQFFGIFCVFFGIFGISK